MRRPGFSVTSRSEARLFRVVGDSMAIESERYDNDEDPLEQTELAARLRRMKWPPAPPEVKARVLERIVTESRQELGTDGDAGAASEPSGG
jgi:hypothetical protein